MNHTSSENPQKELRTSITLHMGTVGGLQMPAIRLFFFKTTPENWAKWRGVGDHWERCKQGAWQLGQVAKTSYAPPSPIPTK